MTAVRLIAVDLDGTLLDDGKQVSTENLEALRNAAQRGILLAVASGRMLSVIEPLESRLGLDCILIAYNGAKVLGRRKDGRPALVHRPLPGDVASFFVDFSRRRGYLLNFYHDEVLYAEEGPGRRRFMDLYSARTGVEYNIVDDIERTLPGVSPTKLIILGDPAETELVAEELRTAIGDRACVIRSEPEYIEITAPGVDKGSVLRTVAAWYGIPLDEVMALGDAENDISMLQVAGVGVAMANAPPQVRAAARHVTERTNNEGGVAEAIRHWAPA